MLRKSSLIIRRSTSERICQSDSNGTISEWPVVAPSTAMVAGARPVTHPPEFGREVFGVIKVLRARHDA
jgi:hypothetical protein